jgi:hypothetical protein
MKSRILIAAAALLAARLAAAAPESSAPQPSAEVQKLSYFVGEWTSEADIHPGPMGAGGKATGSSKCRWLDGNFFVSCQDESSTPMGKMSGLGVMGYDAAKKVYTWSGFNNMGQAEVATGTVSGKTWTFAGSNDINGKTMKTRYTIVETSPAEYTFRFDASTDGATWTPVIDGKVTKK